MKLGAVFCGERCVLPKVWKAANAWERARGLLGRPPLQRGEGLWIEPCGSVHTIGMAYALDLAFLDREGHIRKQVNALLPLRFAMASGTQATLEMAADELHHLGLKPGDRLEWRELP
jgi:uncharacterized membrane protein (UPF0127 family)